MATWTHEVLNPRTEGELFKVDVTIYRDGSPVKTQTFETNQDQGPDWPADGIKRLIQSLQALETLPGKITAGIRTLPADPVVDAAKNAWLADYELATRAKMLVDLNVIASNNAKYTALLARLKTNFKPEYIGLI